jgi:hypothetical protein
MIWGVRCVTLRFGSLTVDSVSLRFGLEATSGLTLGEESGAGTGFCCATCVTVRGLVWLSGLICAQA